jgi:hypothetical protein
VNEAYHWKLLGLHTSDLAHSSLVLLFKCKSLTQRTIPRYDRIHGSWASILYKGILKLLVERFLILSWLNSAFAGTTASGNNLRTSDIFLRILDILSHLSVCGWIQRGALRAVVRRLVHQNNPSVIKASSDLRLYDIIHSHYHPFLFTLLSIDVLKLDLFRIFCLLLLWNIVVAILLKRNNH